MTREEAQAAEATLAAVREAVAKAGEHAARFTGVDDDGPRGILYAQAVGLRRVAALLSAAPAPQHPDSALLDRITEDFRQCVGEHTSNALEFAIRVRRHLSTRAAGQSGGGQ